MPVTFNSCIRKDSQGCRKLCWVGSAGSEWRRRDTWSTPRKTSTPSQHPPVRQESVGAKLHSTSLPTNLSFYQCNKYMCLSMQNSTQLLTDLGFYQCSKYMWASHFKAPSFRHSSAIQSYPKTCGMVFLGTMLFITLKFPSLVYVCVCERERECRCVYEFVGEFICTHVYVSLKI